MISETSALAWVILIVGVCCFLVATFDWWAPSLKSTHEPQVKSPLQIGLMPSIATHIISCSEKSVTDKLMIYTIRVALRNKSEKTLHRVRLEFEYGGEIGACKIDRPADKDASNDLRPDQTNYWSLAQTAKLNGPVIGFPSTSEVDAASFKKQKSFGMVSGLLLMHGSKIIMLPSSWIDQGEVPSPRIQYKAMADDIPSREFFVSLARHNDIGLSISIEVGSDKDVQRQAPIS